MQKSSILITAAGSIGERHIRNLWQLGYTNLLVFRTRNLPFRDIGKAKVTVVLDWQQALQSGAEAAFVTSPTHLHGQQTIDCLRAGMHVFVEKPLAHTTEQLAEIMAAAEQSKKYLQVGYMLEFHPLLQRMKSFCEEQTFGQLLHAESYWGEYLPNWHPWEDYKESYAAKTEMGGGAALTLSHELNTVLWLIGKMPTHHAVHKFTLNALPIQADNLTEIVLQFGTRTAARIHVNYIEKKNKRVTTLLFNNGRISFDYPSSTLLFEDFKTQKEWCEELPNFDRNDLFISETKHFFEQLKTGVSGANHSLERAIEIVKICNG